MSADACFRTVDLCWVVSGVTANKCPKHRILWERLSQLARTSRGNASFFVGRRRPQIRLDLDQRRSFAAKRGESDQNGRLRRAIQYHWLKFAYMTK